MAHHYEGEFANNRLLYEGKHDDWLDDMETIMRVHGFSDDDHSKLCSALEHGSPKDDSYVFSKKALSCVRWQISPGLLARIPETARNKARDFVRALSGVAKPFDIANLPLELRHHIIRLPVRVCRPTDADYVYSQVTWSTFRVPGPTMACVNQEFRTEPSKIACPTPTSSQCLPRISIQGGHIGLPQSSCQNTTSSSRRSPSETI